MSVTANTHPAKECAYILPKLLTPSAALAHACVSEQPSIIRQVREVHNVATQTPKSSCHCQPSAKKGTFVKVSSQYNIIFPVIIRTACLQDQLSYVY